MQRVFRFLAALIVVTVVVSQTVEQVSAQRGGGRDRGREGGGRGGSGGRGGFGGFGGGGGMGLVQRADVQKDLGLSKGQIDEIGDLREKQREGDADRRESMRSRFSGLRDASSEEREKMMAELRGAVEKRNEESRKQVGAVLTKSQMTRLGQIGLQLALRNGNVVNALRQSGAKMSEKETQDLAERERDAQRAFQQRMRELQREARMKLLASVWSAGEIKKMLGADFALEPGERSARGGGGRGRGEAGARRGAGRSTGRSSTRGRSTRGARPASDE